MSKYLELVEGSFNESHFNKQKNQNPYVAYSIKDGNVIYTIVPKEDEDVYLVTAIMLKDISNLTYNEVDLGEAGIWADRNVGALSPEDYGSYFQWGSKEAYTYCINEEFTTEQIIYFLNMLTQGEMEVTKDNVKEVLEMIGVENNNNIINVGGIVIDEKLDRLSFDNYFDTTDGGSTYNKYNNNGGLTILESGDDAATVHMGNGWSMPTKDEVINLINNTTQYIVDINGVEHKYINATTKIGDFDESNLKGVRFEASNGNSIFLPGAGLLFHSPDNGYAVNLFMHSAGYYWTNELNLEESSGYSVGLEMYFNAGDVGYTLSPGSPLRIFAMPIRAIKKS